MTPPAKVQLGWTMEGSGFRDPARLPVGVPGQEHLLALLRRESWERDRKDTWVLGRRDWR